MLRFVVAMLWMGCGGTETPPPEPEPVVEPEPVPEPEPAPPAEMTPDALNAAIDANVGKSVTVAGFYSSMTKQETPPALLVPVFADAEAAGAKVTCVFDAAKEAEITALAPKSAIKVSGTVSAEKDGESAKLDGCALVPAEAAPTEPPPEREKAKVGKGKGGKQKAH